MMFENSVLISYYSYFELHGNDDKIIHIKHITSLKCVTKDNIFTTSKYLKISMQHGFVTIKKP